MTVIIRKDQWYKGVITKEKADQQLRNNACFGWVFTNYLHTPPSAHEKNDWNEFVGRFDGLPAFAQELEKLHNDTKTWCIQHGTLVINTSELTKF